jgi:hypothetical protein
MRVLRAFIYRNIFIPVHVCPVKLFITIKAIMSHKKNVVLHCNKNSLLYTALSCMTTRKQHMAIKISVHFFVENCHILITVWPNMTKISSIMTNIPVVGLYHIIMYRKNSIQVPFHLGNHKGGFNSK